MLLKSGWFSKKDWTTKLLEEWIDQFFLQPLNTLKPIFQTSFLKIPLCSDERKEKTFNIDNVKRELKIRNLAIFDWSILAQVWVRIRGRDPGLIRISKYFWALLQTELYMGNKRRIGKQFHVIVPNKCDGGGVEVFWAFEVGETGERMLPKLRWCPFLSAEKPYFQVFLLDPFHRRGRVLDRKFCVSVDLSVITVSFSEYWIIWLFTTCKPYIFWKHITYMVYMM